MRGVRHPSCADTDEALTAILEEAEDVPYNVQLLAHHCWNMLRDRDRGAALSAAQMDAVHGATTQRLDPIYSQFWLGLTAPQRRALQAVAREGSEGLFRQATSKRYGLSATAMQGRRGADREAGLLAAASGGKFTVAARRSVSGPLGV
jgi:hypothetical protein